MFIAKHLALAWFCLWLINQAINSMPTPREADGKLYKWAFNLLHTLSGASARIERVRHGVGKLLGKLNGNGKTPVGHA